MTHDPQAAQIVEAAIAAELAWVGIPRVRVLPAGDEAAALAILHALDRHGLEIVRKDGPEDGAAS